MSLADIAKRLESAAATATLAGRTLLGLDTNPVPNDWTHVTKVDPETDKQLPLAYPLYLSRTSAVSVGGSSDVTDRNTEETFELLALADVPTFHEPSEATHVTDETRERADFMAVPEVLNGDTEALVGTLGKGLEYVREDLGPRLVEQKVGISLDPDGFFGSRLADFAAGYLIEEAVFEAYIIMNPDSAAAREAKVSEADLLTPQEAKERALAAEYHLESEIVYLEYSGTFGGSEAEDILASVGDAVSWSRIWYGGGLDNRENALAMLDAGADAIVVGDVFHEVAAEERDLFREAREHFESVPDTETLEDWVRDTVAVEETAARRYLSTIPDVDAPEDIAATYLTAGVEFGLHVDAAREETGGDETAIRRHLREESLVREAIMAAEGVDRGSMEDLAMTALDANPDTPGDDQHDDSNGHHLGISV